MGVRGVQWGVLLGTVCVAVQPTLGSNVYNVNSNCDLTLTSDNTDPYGWDRTHVLWIESKAQLDALAASVAHCDEGWRIKGGGLRIRDADDVSDLEVLSMLVAIDGKTSFGYSLFIALNDNLESLTGLRNLKGALPGTLFVDNNGKLKSIAGLEGVVPDRRRPRAPDVVRRDVLLGGHVLRAGRVRRHRAGHHGRRHGQSAGRTGAVRRVAVCSVSGCHVLGRERRHVPHGEPVGTSVGKSVGEPDDTHRPSQCEPDARTDDECTDGRTDVRRQRRLRSDADRCGAAHGRVPTMDRLESQA